MIIQQTHPWKSITFTKNSESKVNDSGNILINGLAWKSIQIPCELKKERCLNCHSHFSSIRPFVKEALASKHFIKDLKNEEEADLIVNEIVNCSSTNFHELHKFEESLDGNLIFRAKKEAEHMVYCVDKQCESYFLEHSETILKIESFWKTRKRAKSALHTFN